MNTPNIELAPGATFEKLELPEYLAKALRSYNVATMHHAFLARRVPDFCAWLYITPRGNLKGSPNFINVLTERTNEHQLLTLAQYESFQAMNTACSELIKALRQYAEVPNEQPQP